MKRSLSDITPVPSSHKVGLKRVLLAAEESGCAITQIAVTDLRGIRGTGTSIQVIRNNIFPQKSLSKCSLN
jgi:hypothetical protein